MYRLSCFTDDDDDDDNIIFDSSYDIKEWTNIFFVPGNSSDWRVANAD